MADGAFPGLVSRSRDVNSASNVIFTQIADDAGNVAGITGGALDVNATVTLDTAYTDGSTDFTVQVSEVNAQGFLVDDTATDAVGEGEIGLARMTTDRIMITDAQQRGTWNIGTVTTLTGITNDVNIADGGNSITVDATDLDIRALDHVTIGDSVRIGDGTETLAINADGSINVVFGATTITGEVHDYDTAATVGSDATDNHDYTVANTTFLLKSVIVSGSGNVKFEVQTGPLASLATVAVGFLTGRQGDTKQIFFDPAVEVPVTSTGTVRVIRTNRQGTSTDLYSTIIGIDQ